MFIVPELDGEKVFHVAYEGRVVNGELEQRAAVFRTEAAFWEVGDHVWETNRLASRASYEECPKIDPVATKTLKLSYAPKP